MGQANPGARHEALADLFPDRPTPKERRLAVGGVLAVAALTGLMVWLVDRAIAGCNWHVAVQFGGSSRGIRDAMVEGCDKIATSDIHLSLWIDSGLALAYGLGGFALLKVLKNGWTHPAPILLLGIGVWSPLAAMILDLLENLLSAIWLRSDYVADSPFQWLPLFLTTIAWTKWALIALALILIFISALAYVFGNRASRVKGQAIAERQQEGSGAAGLAACFSGGGIRSAGFSLGVLISLEETGLMAEVERLSAVSGGAYAATTWRLWKQMRRSQGRPDEPVAQAIVKELLRDVTKVRGIDHVSVARTPETAPRTPTSDDYPIVDESAETSEGDDPDPARIRTRQGKHRFLWNTGGGPAGAVLWGAFCVAFGMGILVAAILIVGWPLGRLVRSWIVLGTDTLSRGEASQLNLTPRHWFPTAIFMTISLFMFGWSIHNRKALAFAAGAFGASASFFLLLIVLPWGLLEFGYHLVAESGIGVLILIGVTLASGAAGTVGRMFIGSLGKVLPRLGGVLLALVLLVFTLKVAAESAFEEPVDFGSISTKATWVRVLIAALALIAAYLLIDIESLNMRRLYRKRIDLAFVPTECRSTEWSGLTEQPELLICAALHHSGLARFGSPSSTFTVSPSQVRQGITELSWVDYARALTPDQRRVAAWMPITGAAFASSMGIRGLGSTGALMAALNVDLGAWLPNVSKVGNGYNKFPRVRLGYFIKEIFGLYSDETDDRVFVADGGHWENLGLVELLRRRHRRIICVDASGDPPRSNAAFREAVVLAQTELEDDFEIDLTPLKQNSANTLSDASASVVGLPFVLKEKSGNRICGWIWYAKLQLSDDQPKGIKRFVRADRRFPYYSTMNQLLDDQQFAYLVYAGRHAGQIIATMDAARRGDVSPWQQTALGANPIRDTEQPSD